MFGVWYAAVGSMHPGVVKARWPSTTKRALQIHYREALEQSLVKNRFMESEDLITLQAFLLFIVSKLEQIIVVDFDTNIHIELYAWRR